MFFILGPLEVRCEGDVVAVGGRRQRALLALLLLRANDVVSADALVEGLWGESPPKTAAHSLQVFVSDLRKALRAVGEDGRIVTQSPGYKLEVRPGELDLERFEQLARDGRAALAGGEPAAAAETLREGLALWRGEPLADFAYEPFAQATVARLEELRLSVLEDRVAADLALGRHAELVGELEELVARHPYREGLAAHLILALYRAGRQSEALAAYQATRKLLLEELGIDPMPELQELERAILVQDKSLDVAARPEQPSAPSEASSLPRPPTPLIGRERELAELERIVGAERLVTLTGPGGIGKTRLALAAAGAWRRGSRTGRGSSSSRRSRIRRSFPRHSPSRCRSRTGTTSWTRSRRRIFFCASTTWSSFSMRLRSSASCWLAARACACSSPAARRSSSQARWSSRSRRSRRMRRSSCSRRVPAPSCPTSPRRGTRRRSAGSASGSTGCRSRSSWRRGGCACSRRRRSWRGSSRRCRSSPAGRVTCRSASRPSAPRSTGATSCSIRISSACFGALSVFLGGFDLEAARRSRDRTSSSSSTRCRR